jgi:hypothetical protein
MSLRRPASPRATEPNTRRSDPPYSAAILLSSDARGPITSFTPSPLRGGSGGRRAGRGLSQLGDLQRGQILTGDFRSLQT